MKSLRLSMNCFGELDVRKEKGQCDEPETLTNFIENVRVSFPSETFEEERTIEMWRLNQLTKKCHCLFRSIQFVNVERLFSITINQVPLEKHQRSVCIH